MRAAAMKERPSFTLMKQTDVQSIYHMQIPRWLFSDPRYAGMSLDAKVAYTFLLNRFQLSRRNGWVNDFGEVFVIFPRKELARELRVSGGAAGDGGVPCAEGAEPDLGEAVRPGRRQPNLLGYRGSPGRPGLHQRPLCRSGGWQLKNHRSRGS